MPRTQLDLRITASNGLNGTQRDSHPATDGLTGAHRGSARPVAPGIAPPARVSPAESVKERSKRTPYRTPGNRWVEKDYAGAFPARLTCPGCCRTYPEGTGADGYCATCVGV